MKRSIILFTFLLGLAVQGLWAQNDTNQTTTEEDSTQTKQVTIALQRRVEKNRVILRWAPSQYTLFRHGVENGYTLERRAYTQNPEEGFSKETNVDGDFKVIKKVMPWSQEEWEKNATDSTDIYAGVAMQILLGGEISTQGQGEMSSIKSHYEDQQRKFAFGLISADLSTTAALGLGLRYEDKDIKPGYYYEYRVRFNSLPEGFDADTAWTFADTKRPYKAQKVKHCFLEASDKKITVFWTRHNDQFFTAYDVERSTDKITWTRLNEKPWMTSLYSAETPNFMVDSIANNNQNYYYRIMGYTPFGDKGVYSDIMGEKGIDLTAPAPAWGVKAEDMGGYVAIKWEAMPVEPDFDGFYIERSNAANGYFERISQKLPKDIRQFADLSPIQLSSNYYRVSCIDKKGNESHSFSDLGYLVDSFPPDKPFGLRGKIDTTGKVELDWSPGPEADIIGYRIYWSNNKDLEFTQLVGDVIPGINFVDSIKVKTLNEEIYYRIAAVDHRYNHSEMSNILTLKKPDLVPPAAPLIHDYHVNDHSVEFKWYPSSSSDAVSQTILRQVEDSTWKTHKTWARNTDSLFKDERVVSGVSYAYKIVTTDDAGNQSQSQILQVTVVDEGFIKTNIKATIKVEDNAAQLNWTESSKKVKYTLYKQRGETRTKLTSLYAPISQWNDADYQPGDVYQMRMLFPKGNESQLITFSIK